MMINAIKICCFLFVILFLTNCNSVTNSENNRVDTAELSVSKQEEMPIILTWDYNIFVMGAKEIAEFVASAKENNIGQINLRINNKGVSNIRIKHGTVYFERLDAFGEDFDPLRVFVDECRKHQIKAGVHFDLFESSYDKFFIDNPQFTPQDSKDKINYSAFPCYAHEEVQEYLLNRVKEVAGYGVDAIFFCTKSSHTPKNMIDIPRNSYAPYNSPIVDRYKDKYGVDILTEEPEREKVAKIHGEYIVEFLIKAKEILGHYGVESIAGATLSGYLQASRKNIFVDWKDIVDNDAADALTMSNTRGETFAWYQDGAQDEFIEISKQVKKKGIKFYGYILSTVYWDIRDRFSSADMLEFISDQMAYFYKMEAEGLLIHEVYRKEIWEVLGSWEINQPDLSVGSNIEIPWLNDTTSRFQYQVPCGGFEEEKSYWFWDVMPGWLSVLDWLPFRNSAPGLNLNDFNSLWTAENGNNQFLHAEYDWKVMANSEYSGRAYSGRSSMLFYANAGAGTQQNRTVSWNATSRIPITMEGRSIFSTWIHGEDLNGIEAAGMEVNFKDEKGGIIGQFEKKIKVNGTFPWRPIQFPSEFPSNTYEIEVKLFMTVGKNENVGGRLWFDKFQVLSEGLPGKRELEIFESNDAPEGNKYAGIKIFKGEEVISIPFRLDISKKAVLELTARTGSQSSMLVVVELDSVSSKIQLTDEWQTFSFDLKGLSDQTIAELKIRPLSSGMLYLDQIKIE